ncbi:exopolyphosphatase [Lyophyllum atratum]|nr:exopolyphosphatase [Lyophyllum atratum]
MRNPIRRLSIALKMNKPPEATPAAPGTLVQFLTQSRGKYLCDIHATPSKAGEWTVVMGNEAGDLDSVASSIGFAWLQSEVHKKPTIPLLQLDRDDLDLRAENTYALRLAGIDKPKEQLLFLTDLADIKPFPSQNFALVDHNRLGALYTASNPSAKVVAVIDHHEDEGLYKDTANPRIIAPCGSCASHIAALCPSEVPSDLATLLLCAILIDTNGLKPGGKATPTDLYAAGFLASRSTLASELPQKLVTALLDDPKSKPEALHDVPAIRELKKTLVQKKGDISHLSGRDLLRRDYKDYSYTLPWAGGQTVKAGIASVPVSLKSWAKDGALEEAAIPWMKERGIDILGVLTSYNAGKKGKGKHKREMAWVVYGGAEKEKEEEKEEGDKTEAGAEAGSGAQAGAEAEAGAEADPIEGIFDKLPARLWKGLEDSGELKLKKHKKFDLEKAGKLPAGARARVYRQNNGNATRKVTAPLLKNILEAQEPEPTPTKGTKK